MDKRTFHNQRVNNIVHNLKIASNYQEYQNISKSIQIDKRTSHQSNNIHNSKIIELFKHRQYLKFEIYEWEKGRFTNQIKGYQYKEYTI